MSVFMNRENQSDLKKAQLLLTFSRGAKSRRSILETVLVRPKNCNQISKETGLDWWTVQKHLQRLLNENLVKTLDFGQIKFYDITYIGKNALKLCLDKKRSL